MGSRCARQVGFATTRPKEEYRRKEVGSVDDDGWRWATWIAPHIRSKPVMIGEFGEALVMDWGVARDRTGILEPLGVVAGTPAFMAPEQVSGSAEVDARADVYGLGATLASVVDQLPKPLASIVAKAKAARAEDRYPSARELADDIGRFLDGGRVHAHRESIAERAARFAARHRVALLLFAVYLAVRLGLALLAHSRVALGWNN